MGYPHFQLVCLLVILRQNWLLKQKRMQLLHSYAHNLCRYKGKVVCFMFGVCVSLCGLLCVSVFTKIACDDTKKSLLITTNVNKEAMWEMGQTSLAKL